MRQFRPCHRRPGPDGQDTPDRQGAPISASSPPTTTCCRRISRSAAYPDIIKDAAMKAGGVAQVAGGVPAMCDGITQGQPGMELSLFSRDAIAMGTAIALSHNAFDAALMLGVCDKIVPRAVDRRLAVRSSAGDLRAGRTDGHRHFQFRKIPRPPALRHRQGRPRRPAPSPRPRLITAPAPAPSTGPPIPISC